MRKKIWQRCKTVLFTDSFQTFNSGILTTGEFTDDAIHCKLQSLLEHLYSALFIFCLVW